MTTEEQLEKLHVDMERQLREIEFELKHLADKYGDKMIEWRKIKGGIIGIEAELERIKGSGLND
ncbi:hypothetical protein COJ96_05775 [Bacillus sp. AFS073361]|uniref:hypothetical protein n=1 Tax=Bacillus sp. AFS073361 TaxID=2033511 RepID=UPI000BF617AC|nr:hypothetical protein [Bacillus sp. AFS073361]PFP30222.1 hypothetical protein COJ96_05775 [Bacillus sp. AFS073361]